MEVAEVAEVVEHENLFEKVFAKGKMYLKFVGLQLDSNDGNRKFIDRLRFRWFFVFIFLTVNLDFSGQITWLIGNVISGNSDMIEITFVVPCLTVTLMGSVKSFYFLKNAHHIHEIITTLKKLKMKSPRITRKLEDKFEKKSVQFLYTANKIITWATVLGITSFGLGPLLITAKIYYYTGEIKLLFPFIFYYPFNAYDIRVWPFLYAQQLCTIWGPDYVCYAITTFMIIQLFSLKQDIVHLIRKLHNHELFLANDAHRVKLRDIVKCHNDLLRCADLMETTYTKTILFNVIFSSILICFNVFNITTNNNIVLMAPFTAFLIMVLGQIFLLCYFGDVIMRSTVEVSDAIYQCLWYRAESDIVRDLIIISLRANKPSKLSAYGYSDVNLKTFAKILSTSWSYLALLQTVYNKAK